MKLLLIAGVLALAAAQSSVDPSVLEGIFGTPPTPTRQPLEDVPRSTTNGKVEGLPTIKSSLLTDVFGTPPTTNSSTQTHEDVNSTRDTEDLKVEGLPTLKPSLLTEIFGTPPPKSSRPSHGNDSTKENPQYNSPVQGVHTIKPSLLTEVFGTPPTPNSSRPSHENESLKEDSQGTRDTNTSQVGYVPTIKPSVLTEVFGTPSTPNSQRPSHENDSIKDDPQGTRDTNTSQVGYVPTIEPSLLTEVFGTPSTPNSPRPSNENESIKEDPQGTRGTNTSQVGYVPTIKPSVLTDIFGTPPTPDSSRQGYQDRNSKNDTQGTRNVNVEGVPTIDPSLLIDVFGTAPTPAEKTSKERCYEDITVKPTEGTSTFLDKDGQYCQCVPYYLCDSNNVGVDANNASVTGWGELDIRFGEGDNSIDRHCQESVEVCCSIPKDPTEQPKPPKPQPKPDPVKGCGYRNPRGLGVTITGGSGAESQFGEFPWVVALLDNHNSSYAGVGVLINPAVVMTGAHIAQKYGPGGLKIRAGEWDTQTVKEIYPYEERVVESTVIHENFMPKSLKNDIALLRLDRPLEISAHINVICMPDVDEVFDSSKNCVANGWGKTHFGQSNRYAVILKKVEQDMVPYSRCNTLLKRTRLGHNFKLHNSFVCAGGEAGKDTCQGDGGAPLACPIGNNRYKLTGLVAWGIGCGQQDVPAVYTNVPLFRQWVDDKMAAWGLEATSYRIPNDE